VFSSPSEVVRVLQTVGFGNGPYEGTLGGRGPAFFSSGQDVNLASDREGEHNEAAAYLAGADADRIDEIIFNLSVKNPSRLPDSMPRFNSLVKRTLSELGVGGGSTFEEALEQRDPGNYSLDGAKLIVRRQEMPQGLSSHPGAHTLSFRFTRPGAPEVSWN
jgi:hypothetical protein